MINVTVDTRAVTRMLTDLQAKQIPFATQVALNRVGFDIQKAERAAFSSLFHSPRPFTANAPLVKKATKSAPSVTIFIRPEAARYLQPYETGGAHVIPGKLLLDPVALRLDRYGQMTRQTVAKLNAAANDPASGVFLGTVHGTYGYWQRVGGGTITRTGRLRQLGLRLLARLEQPGAVHVHLDFAKRASDMAGEFYPEFVKALGAALTTAKNP